MNPEQLKTFRERKGFSQEELAELVPCDPTTISRYETGKLIPPLEFLQRISEILRFDIIVQPKPRNPKVHLSHHEIKDLMKILSIPEQALVRLIYEGGMGDFFQGIAQLTFEDINQIAQTIQVYRKDGSCFSYFLSRECIELLLKTCEENSQRFLFYPKKGTPASAQTHLYSFFHEIKNKAGLDVFSPNMIKQSGYLHMAQQLKERDGCEKEEHLEEIAKAFQLSLYCDSDRIIPHLKQVVSSENLKRTYDPTLQISFS